MGTVRLAVIDYDAGNCIRLAKGWSGPELRFS